MVVSIHYKDESSKYNRGRDKSRSGLRIEKNEQYVFVLFVFLKFPKNLTFGPVIRESVANLIFRFVPRSIWFI